MAVYTKLNDAAQACRDLTALGAKSLFRQPDRGFCPSDTYSQLHARWHCVHRFPDQTEVCCGCEKVFSESPTKIREKEIRFKQLEEEGL